MPSSKISLIVFLFLIPLFLISISLLKNTSLDQTILVQDPEAKVQVDSNTHSWGEIPINGGDVTQDFTITNQGTKPLSLSDVKTSCSCTTAYFIKGKEKSPLFGMHTKSNYRLILQPQEQTTLRVIYDPAFHGPNGVGPITRIVTLRTNDPSQPELNFTLTALVRNN